MTTVAFRDGVLAADSFVTDESTAMQVRKIVRLPKGYAAIGSGAQGALVAMKLGCTAEQAVAAVAGVDHCTGGEIEVLAYVKPKRTK